MKKYFRPETTKRTIDGLIKQTETLDKKMSSLVGKWVELHAEVQEMMSSYTKQLVISEYGYEPLPKTRKKKSKEWGKIPLREAVLNKDELK